jgi:hypothetical protein
MDQLWVVDISGGSVERGDLMPDREAVSHFDFVILDEVSFAPLDDTGAQLFFRFVAAA